MPQTVQAALELGRAELDALNELDPPRGRHELHRALTAMQAQRCPTWSC